MKFSTTGNKELSAKQFICISRNIVNHPLYMDEGKFLIYFHCLLLSGTDPMRPDRFVTSPEEFNETYGSSAAWSTLRQLRRDGYIKMKLIRDGLGYFIVKITDYSKYCLVPAN